MLVRPHVAETIEIDFPPGSGDIVGRVDISRHTLMAGYAAVAGYLGDQLIYQKRVQDHIIRLRNHEARIQRVADKAARKVRYDASLMFDLPDAVDLSA